MRRAAALVLSIALAACSGDDGQGAAGTGAGQPLNTGSSGQGGGETDGAGGAPVSCPESAVLTHVDKRCGGGVSGVCAPRPDNCLDPASEPDVCGCDGQVYGSRCLANQAGQDVDAEGGCGAPPGTFECAESFCKRGSEACATYLDGAGKESSTGCIKLPSDCLASPSCDCFAGDDFVTSCEEPGPDELYVTFKQ